jgi:hypothetical protein
MAKCREGRCCACSPVSTRALNKYTIFSRHQGGELTREEARRQVDAAIASHPDLDLTPFSTWTKTNRKGDVKAKLSRGDTAKLGIQLARESLAEEGSMRRRIEFKLSRDAEISLTHATEEETDRDAEISIEPATEEETDREHE